MFEVGQMVVCVDDGPRGDGRIVPLKKGTIYTIASYHPGVGRNRDGSRGKGGVSLNEVPSPPRSLRFKGRYCATRFRPIRKHSIEIFQDIANGVKQPEKENA